MTATTYLVFPSGGHHANRQRAIEFRRLAGGCANVTSSTLDRAGSSRLRASRKNVDLSAVLRYDEAAILKSAVGDEA
jgi:hypothetical protein